MLQILAIPLIALKAIVTTLLQPDPVEEFIRAERVKAQRFVLWGR